MSDLEIDRDDVRAQIDAELRHRNMPIILLVGMILDRFDVSWFAVRHPDPLTYIPTLMANNAHYLPSLPEISISVGIFSAGILAFGLAAKYLPLFESEEEAAHTGQPRTIPTSKAASD